ncbi:MAG: transposase [Armatimonadota bacterium]
MARQRVRADELDGPWKEALELEFPGFFRLFFPEAAAEVDWVRGYTFLDKELERVVRRAKVGPRVVDKLAKVWLLSGEEAWVLIHVEVQSQPDAGFARRMYVYNYRLFDRYQRPVVSIGVLGDTQPDWRPDRFEHHLWGCRAGLQFPVVKLLDWEARWAELESSRNLFAAVVMAHLRTQSTRNDPQSRLQWKLRIVKGLYHRGFTREQIIEVFRFIDWMMALPEELELGFETEIAEYEEEQVMPYVTSVERIGVMRGFRDALVETLTARFGTLPATVSDRLDQIRDQERLRELQRVAATAATLDEFLGHLSQNA